MIYVDVLKCYDLSRDLAKKGLFIGQSSGVYLQGAMQIADEISEGKIATIFNDIGERYFSTALWEEPAALNV